MQQYFAVLETRTPTRAEYNYCPNIVFMISNNRGDPLYIQIPHPSSVIGALECVQPQKYTDNSEYDVLAGSISSIYTARLAEGSSGDAATVSVITTNERHSKVYAKILVQKWRIKLDPAQKTLKTKT